MRMSALGARKMVRSLIPGLLGGLVASTLGGLVASTLGGCQADPVRRPAGTDPTTVVPAAPETPSVNAPASGPAETPTTIAYPPAATQPQTAPVAAPAPTVADLRARPISGGTLRVLSDGRTAIASDSDRDQVYVVDLVTAKVTHVIALQKGDEPGRSVEDLTGRVHVALRSGGAIATIDPVAGTVLARRALCAAPRGLAIAPVSQTLHVACAGGELVSIAADPTVEKASRTLSFDRDLRDVVVKNDQLFVSTFRSSQVLVVGADGKLAQRLTPAADVLAGTASVAWRMIDGPGDQTIILHQRGVTGQIGTFPGAYSSFDGCGSIVSSTVSVVSTDGTDIATGPGFQGANVAADVALSPDGSQLAVVSIAGGDAGEQVQFFSASITTSSKGSIGRCQSPEGMNAPAPSSDDTSDGSGDQMGLPSPGNYLPPNGQIVAIAYDARGNVIVQSREPATLQILTQRGDPITLSTESRFDAGQLLFHTATSSQIACVSCHPEGGEDGRVWQFQKLGARRTQSLRGGIMDTAPFHWSGDEASLSSIMTDVFQGRMRGPSVDTSGVSALGTWLGQIPTIPVSQWNDTATIARGKALFASAACASCHTGADFTNGTTVDVGTGAPFQVPQLHGLGFRAPYMHDGCAATLQARLAGGACGGDDRHGNLKSLTTTQTSDLIAYLDTL
jgi:Cytochrome c